MIIAEHIGKSFGSKTVLSDVSFSLTEGEIVGLVGPSGGGKTVLLKVLGGILKPDSGRLLYKDASGQHRLTSVGFSFQEGALFDSMTVLENVAFPVLSSSSNGHSAPKVGFKEAMRRAYQILADVGLPKDIHKMPGQISGGMRRRVGIARALVANPRLVLLDDPTGGLDPVAASVIVNLIKRLHKQHTPTVIMVSHDIRRLLPNVDRVLGLFSGRIVLSARPEEVVKSSSREVVDFLSTRFDFSQFERA